MSSTDKTRGFRPQNRSERPDSTQPPCPPARSDSSSQNPQKERGSRGKIHHRPRRPGEVTTPLAAIRNHCIECMGYQPALVKTCPARECWLWPYRLGRRPNGEEENDADATN